MENFFVDDYFYREIEDLVEELFYGDEEEIEELPDDYELEAVESILEPIVQLNGEWITEKIDSDRFSEDWADDEVSKIMKILNANIDWDKINKEIPSLYYETRNKFFITKTDLLDAIK